MDSARRLRLAFLAPGDVGIIEATVAAMAPVRTYQRGRGGEGTMARVTLADSTGEADLVLWESETQRLGEPAFRVGTRLRLRGAAVKVGYRGGVELGLGSAVVEVLPGSATEVRALEGLLSLSPSRLMDGTLQADAAVGEARLVVSGALLLDCVRLAGHCVKLGPVAAHPILAGWFLTGPAPRVEAAATAQSPAQNGDA